MRFFLQNQTKNVKNKLSIFFLLFSLLIIWVGIPSSYTGAQAVDINWERPVNISNSPATSTDPFLLADPAGIAHLFWAEKTGPTPGNAADTIMYSAWNGNIWTQPVDLYISPLSDGNPIAIFPRGVIDETGTIHLIWITLPNFPHYALYYRQASSWKATNNNAWSQPLQLARNLTGQQYSADIAYNPEQGLHIVYARGTGGLEGRAITYLNSLDKGNTWSDTRDLYIFTDPDRGGSNIRILLDAPNHIYISWTEWDLSGNGQAIYFTYSEDNGETWAKPFPLTVRLQNDYERDWNNMAILGSGQLVSIWEGGFRAYRGAMYSYDSGKTWTEPFDVFPSLIGDNGAVQFAFDSKGRLHTFLANRVREGYDVYGERLGLWHSVYLGEERWEPPTIASVYGGDENMTNPAVTIINGNNIVAAWYGSQIYEIMVMTGTILDAPPLSPTRWPTLIPTVEEEVLITQTANNDLSTQQPSITPSFAPEQPPTNPANPIYVGLIFPVLLIFSLFLYRYKFNHRS